MRIVKINLCLLMMIMAFTSCKDQKQSETHSIEVDDISFTKEGQLTFLDSTGVELKEVAIELAVTPYEQETGLMYRKSMKENQGMLFIYDNAQPRPYFYMKNTYISLDLVYIGTGMKIVDINTNAKPLDESLISSKAKSKYVLEINGGMADKWGLSIGDSVTFDANRNK